MLPILSYHHLNLFLLSLQSPPSDMTLFWRSENYGISLPTTEGGRKHLPQPRGPHSVGYVDLMTPGDPSMGSFVRILYPTKEQCLSNEQKWPIWAEDDYLTGFVKFVQVGRQFSSTDIRNIENITGPYYTDVKIRTTLSNNAATFVYS
jgi:hypothetical protein